MTRGDTAPRRPGAFLVRNDAWGFPMMRRWLGPWVLVAGYWFRPAIDFRWSESIGQRRWVFGPKAIR